jgi:DNA-binding NtrC family response regulator
MKVILVVDDKEDLRLMLEIVIKEHSSGHKVLQASNGKVAVDLYKIYKPDLVFMDMRMPIMSGCESIIRIKDFDENANIIITSAYAEHRQTEKLVSRGVVSQAMNKPLDLDEVWEAIADCDETSEREDETGIYIIVK